MAAKNKSAHQKKVTDQPPRSRAILFWILAVIALAGLADATFLTVAHLTGDDAVCGSVLGCSEVLSSPYASLGKVPTAALGAVAYFAVFSLAVLGAFGYTGVGRLLAIVVGLMFLASLYFLYLQAFVLHAFCPFCLLSAALTFLLAGLLLAFPVRR